MKMTSVSLGNDLYARLTTDRSGQQNPTLGDLVTVTGAVFLPSDENLHLHESLRFGERVLVGGHPLHQLWGYRDEKYPGVRVMQKNFSAKTWFLAEMMAKLWCREQIEPLTLALAARRRALEDAEVGV